jgi:hypothetical protein
MQVKLETKPDYVLTTFTGPLSLPEVHQAVRESIDAAADSGLHRILFDWTGMDAVLTTGQRLGLAETAVDHARGKTWKEQLKAATVGRFPAVNGLAAVVASNRGFSLQTFLGRQQAPDWLGIRARRRTANPIAKHAPAVSLGQSRSKSRSANFN